MDGTIPRKHLGKVLGAINAMVRRLRPAGGQCVSCRRRQPAPADPVRRQQAGRTANAPRNSAQDSRTVRQRRRHHHRRARRRRREDQPDVRAVRQRRTRRSFTPSNRRSTRTGCSIPARRSRRWHAARNTGACTSTAARCRFPNWSAFERRRRCTRCPARPHCAGIRRTHAGAPDRRRHQGLLRTRVFRRNAVAGRPLRRDRLRAVGAGADRARRHAVARRRNAARRARPDAGVRAAAFRRRRDTGRHRRLRTVGAAPPTRRRGPRFRARHAHHQWQGRTAVASAAV